MCLLSLIYKESDREIYDLKIYSIGDINMPATIVESFNKNDLRTDGENRFLNLFKNNERFDGWTVFEQPHINGKKPDFVLTHQRKGVVIVEVKDWNLESANYKDLHFRGSDHRLHEKNPISQVEGYKNTILDLELQTISKLSDHFPNRYYSAIETVVFFHGTDKKTALEFCKYPKNTKIWTEINLQRLESDNYELDAKEYTFAITRNSHSILNENEALSQVVDELNHHLSYSDYNRERRAPLKLTSSQKQPLKSIKGSMRRWGGVAGSGKSIILAEKAVQALKDTEDFKSNRVLLLSFNLTLRHYLRDLCSQQFGVERFEGDRKRLKYSMSIEYFHELLMRIMNDYNIKREGNSEDFTEIWISRIEYYLSEETLREEYGYDYIFIDEGQDFKPSWIKFLQKLYTKDGEFFIVYDRNQDIYKRFSEGIWIEDSDQVRGLGFRGSAGYLKVSERIPEKIVNMINKLSEEVFIGYDKISVSTRNSNKNEQINLLQTVKWLNLEANTVDQKVNQVDALVHILLKENQYEDITIITTNEFTGVSLVKHFHDRVNVSHVYDLDLNEDKEIRDNNRRSQKKRFHGGTGNLKISSYQSYKGWQTPNVILVMDHTTTKYDINDPNRGLHHSHLDKEALVDALFISMTRLKERTDTSGFSFWCLNYIPEFNDIEDYFDQT